jgi:hypothetical protein
MGGGGVKKAVYVNMAPSRTYVKNLVTPTFNRKFSALARSLSRVLGGALHPFSGLAGFHCVSPS